LRHEGQESAGSHLFSEAAPALHVMRLRETASRPSGSGRCERQVTHVSRGLTTCWMSLAQRRCKSICRRDRLDPHDRSSAWFGGGWPRPATAPSEQAGAFARPNRCGIVPPLERTARSTRLERRCHRQRKAPDAWCKIDLPARAARSSRPLFRLIRRRLTSPTVVYATNPTVLSERGWRTTWWPRRRELLAPLSALNARLLACSFAAGLCPAWLRIPSALPAVMLREGGGLSSGHVSVRAAVLGRAVSSRRGLSLGGGYDGRAGDAVYVEMILACWRAPRSHAARTASFVHPRSTAVWATSRGRAPSCEHLWNKTAVDRWGPLVMRPIKEGWVAW